MQNQSLGLVFIITIATPLGAQPTAAKFEVASIRPCRAGDSGSRGRKGEGKSANVTPPNSPGRLSTGCETVEALIRSAYILYATGALVRDPSNPPLDSYRDLRLRDPPCGSGKRPVKVARIPGRRRNSHVLPDRCGSESMLKLVPTAYPVNAVGCSARLWPGLRDWQPGRDGSWRSCDDAKGRRLAQEDPYSTRRWSVTEKTPGTLRACMTAMFRSVVFATAPARVTCPLFTIM